LAISARPIVGDRAPELQHHHAVGDCHHQPHVVLDQQQRRTRVAQAQQVFVQRRALGGVQAGGRLVDEQEPRVGGDRARQLDSAAIAERQIFGVRRRDVIEPEPRERRACAIVGFTALAARTRQREEIAGRIAALGAKRARDDVLEHGHLAEQTRVLKRAAHPQRRDAVASRSRRPRRSRRSRRSDGRSRTPR
jgi:hypothetical protein